MEAPARGARRDVAMRTPAFFREINDRVAELCRRRGAVAPRFVCECPRVDCGATFELSLDDYARVRSDAARFVVLAGHEDIEAGDVLERHGGCLVVGIPGAGARAASDGGDAASAGRHPGRATGLPRTRGDQAAEAS